VDAASKAVSSFSAPLILIAGGRHKGGDYEPLLNAAKGRVKKAVFMGESKALLAGSFEGTISYSLAGDMEDAVEEAYSCAVPGDIVLLAPACSSFDMYSDYSQRGKAFKSAVEGLMRV
jgi:UDP-N-acetylmuramoylalanine--D-glutamate ligase